MNWLPLYGPIVARFAGSDVPLALLLGHIQVESGGRPTDRTSLDERGLFQIHPATSREMGFNHDAMFDANYSIWAGVEMFKRMADRIQRQYAHLFPRGRDDFFWHLVRFEFAIGSGAFHQIVTAMQRDGFPPASWADFSSYLSRNRAALLQLTRHDPVKWTSNVDRVFEAGQRIVRTGVTVATVGAGAALVVVGAILVLLVIRDRAVEA